MSAASLTPSGHETKPPARYTEATLIKELEEREIGRPSTYASIIGTILNRGYVYKKGTALVPAWIAFSVVRLLEEHFPRQISYEFTAGMEDVLDEIAGRPQGPGHRARRVLLRLRPTSIGLHQLVNELGEIDAKELATFPVGGPDSGIVLRVGRYGPYLEGPGERRRRQPAGRRANVPDDLPPDELTLDKARELLANPAGEEKRARRAPRDRPAGRGQERPLRPLRHRGRCPRTRRSHAKPRTGSLFESMSLDTVIARRRA